MTPASDRLLLVAAALLFSTGGAAIKFVTLSAWQVSGLRSLVAGTALLLLSGEARRTWLASRRAVLVALAYAATLTLFVAANKLTTSANAIFLQSTAPAYLLLLGPWLLRERASRADLAMLAVMAAGMACVFVGAPEVQRTAPNPPLGNLLALASGVAWAFTIAGLRWMRTAEGTGTERGSAIGAVTLGNFVTFAVAAPFAFPVAFSGAGDVLGLLHLGVFQVGLAYVCLSRGLAGVPALEASLLLLLEPALNPVWAWWLHGERPGPWAVIGGVLIIGATTIKSAVDARRSAAARPRDEPDLPATHSEGSAATAERA